MCMCYSVSGDHHDYDHDDGDVIVCLELVIIFVTYDVYLLWNGISQYRGY